MRAVLKPDDEDKSTAATTEEAAELEDDESEKSFVTAKDKSNDQLENSFQVVSEFNDSSEMSYGELESSSSGEWELDGDYDEYTFISGISESDDSESSEDAQVKEFSVNPDEFYNHVMTKIQDCLEADSEDEDPLDVENG